jgi:hypothetical protein
MYVDYYLVVGASGAVFCSSVVSFFFSEVVFLGLAGAFFLGAGVLTAPLLEPPQAVPPEPQAVLCPKTVPPEDKSPATVMPARMRFSLSDFICGSPPS